MLTVERGAGEGVKKGCRHGAAARTGTGKSTWRFHTAGAQQCPQHYGACSPQEQYSAQASMVYQYA